MIVGSKNPGFCVASLALVAFAIGAGGAAKANCDTRHFYNNSTVAFQFTYNGTGGGSCSVGNSGMLPSCTIPPLSSGDLHYPNFPATGTAITIQSNDGGAVYPPTSFSVNIEINGNCHIDHSGNTGNIVVNSAADGDVATCGASTYPCQVSKPKTAKAPPEP